MHDDYQFPPKRSRTGHKGTFGTVLGIGGSRGMAGSVAMAGSAALLSGAGLVRIAVPDPVLETVASYSPEPTTIPCPADKSGRFRIAALESLLTHAAEATAVFCGPGFGRSDDLNKLVPQFLRQLTKPVIVDADALNALAGSFDFPVREPMILTPHSGEFARLRGEHTPPEEEPEKRKAAAFNFAKRFGVVLVLKGHETLITDGNRLTVNTTGNPGMATGGSGDVLTGMIAGLVAQNYTSVFEAVRFAVYLHGLAGDITAKRFGEQSVTATAILNAIPDAFLNSML